MVKLSVNDVFISFIPLFGRLLILVNHKKHLFLKALIIVTKMIKYRWIHWYIKITKTLS